MTSTRRRNGRPVSVLRTRSCRPDDRGRTPSPLWIKCGVPAATGSSIARCDYRCWASSRPVARSRRRHCRGIRWHAPPPSAHAASENRCAGGDWVPTTAPPVKGSRGCGPLGATVVLRPIRRSITVPWLGRGDRGRLLPAARPGTWPPRPARSGLDLLEHVAGCFDAFVSRSVGGGLIGRRVGLARKPLGVARSVGVEPFSRAELAQCTRVSYRSRRPYPGVARGSARPHCSATSVTPCAFDWPLPCVVSVLVDYYDRRSALHAFLATTLSSSSTVGACRVGRHLLIVMAYFPVRTKPGLVVLLCRGNTGLGLRLRAGHRSGACVWPVTMVRHATRFRGPALG